MLFSLYDFIFKGVRVGDARIVKRAPWFRKHREAHYFPEVFTKTGWKNVADFKAYHKFHFPLYRWHDAAYNKANAVASIEEALSYLNQKPLPVEIIPYIPPTPPKIIN